MSTVGAAFSHLALSVSDLKASQSFYVSAFDFQPGRPYSGSGRQLATFMDVDPAGFSGIFLLRGQFLLELLEHTGERSIHLDRRPPDVGIAHFGLIVGDLEATTRAVAAAGGRVLSRMDYRFGEGAPTLMAFCADPDGNRIELISHQDRPSVAEHADFLGLTDLGWPGEALQAAPLAARGEGRPDNDNARDTP